MGNDTQQLAPSTQELRKPYVWKTHDGEFLTVTEMRTLHLFYTVRMLFNHTAPPALRIPGTKKWKLNHTMVQRVDAVRAMMPELARRDDLPDWAKEQMAHMARAARSLFSTHLPQDTCTPRLTN